MNHYYDANGGPRYMAWVPVADVAFIISERM